MNVKFLFAFLLILGPGCGLFSAPKANYGGHDTVDETLAQEAASGSNGFGIIEDAPDHESFFTPETGIGSSACPNPFPHNRVPVTVEQTEHPRFVSCLNSVGISTLSLITCDLGPGQIAPPRTQELAECLEDL